MNVWSLVCVYMVTVQTLLAAICVHVIQDLKDLHALKVRSNTQIKVNGWLFDYYSVLYQLNIYLYTNNNENSTNNYNNNLIQSKITY